MTALPRCLGIRSHNESTGKRARRMANIGIIRSELVRQPAQALSVTLRLNRSVDEKTDSGDVAL